MINRMVNIVTCLFFVLGLIISSFFAYRVLSSELVESKNINIAKPASSDGDNQAIRSSNTIVSDQGFQYLSMYSLERLEKIIILIQIFILLFSVPTIGLLFYERQKIAKLQTGFQDKVDSLKYEVNQLKSELMEKVLESSQNAIQNHEAVLKNVRNFSSRLDNQHYDIEKTVKNQVEMELNSVIYSKIDKASKTWEKYILNLLDKDFSSSLEKRYLRAENLLGRINSIAFEKIIFGLNINDKQIVRDGFSIISIVQKGVRQMLSADHTDVFNGIGTINSIIRKYDMPNIQFWTLLCLLKKQGRLDVHTLSFANRIGADFGRNYEDRNTSEDER